MHSVTSDNLVYHVSLEEQLLLYYNDYYAIYTRTCRTVSPHSVLPPSERRSP